MSALKSVALAIAVAIRKRDQASKQLVQAQRTFEFAQSQLDQLESYAADSESRWTASARISMRPELLQHHYQFMGRLRHAIDLQNEVIAERQQQLNLVKRLALDAEFRLAGLHKLMHRKQLALAQLMARRDQKLTDEFAAMQFARAEIRLHWREPS